MGDKGGTIQLFTIKHSDVQQIFKSPTKQQISRLELGGALGKSNTKSGNSGIIY